MFRPEKIISGGQTGADIGGLVAARRVGVPTGGTAPRDFNTEKGPKPDELKAFGLVMHPSSHYRDRTKENVLASDATLIFCENPDSPGTQLTIALCKEYKKPHLLIRNISDESLPLVIRFLESENPRVLNIAGNRESSSPGIARRVAAFVSALFTVCEPAVVGHTRPTNEAQERQPS